MDQAIFLSTSVISGIAATAAGRGNVDPDQNIIAALFSAAWLEAALNELMYELIRRDEGELYPELREARRAAIAADLFESQSASIELKLRLLCATVTGHQLNFGRQPWQDVSLLLSLRNWLVHLRPELMKIRQGTDEEPSTIVSRDVHKLVKALRAAKAIAEIPPGRLVPVVIAAGLPGVGRWSYTTAYRALDAVAKWHPGWSKRLLLATKKPIDL
jgi:hypothetical protein